MVFGNPCERVIWPQRAPDSQVENHLGKGWQLVRCSRTHVLQIVKNSLHQNTAWLCVCWAAFLLLHTHS